MWSIETAEDLVKEGKKSKDQLAKSLAEYLGYALDTLNYYDESLKKERKK